MDSSERWVVISTLSSALVSCSSLLPLFTAITQVQIETNTSFWFVVFDLSCFSLLIILIELAAEVQSASAAAKERSRRRLAALHLNWKLMQFLCCSSHACCIFIWIWFLPEWEICRKSNNQIGAFWFLHSVYCTRIFFFFFQIVRVTQMPLGFHSTIFGWTIQVSIKTTEIVPN